MKRVFESRKSNTFSLSVGVGDRDISTWEEEASSLDYIIANQTFPKATTKVLLGKNANPGNIKNTVESFAGRASVIDTMFFFFSGHGLPDSINLARGKSTLDYPKDNLFHDLSLFPGRRIVILSSCHGGFQSISPNTLLVTPSQQETHAFGRRFFVDVLHEFIDASHAPHALTYLINSFLTNYHNRPYGPLNDRVWEQDPHHPDLDIYKVEKETGQILLMNYQRAFVLSSILGDGTILRVDPKCYFPR
ncbi:caspase family protein [Candidatus Woesebacteria bacterium]|nr:caspase family protein [Candidatus Woesebacteria bacterium]